MSLNKCSQFNNTALVRGCYRQGFWQEQLVGEEGVFEFSWVYENLRQGEFSNYNMNSLVLLSFFQPCSEWVNNILV